MSAGTQPNDRLRLCRMRGLGMPVLGSTLAKGDHFVHVNVVLPPSTSQRQRELPIECKTKCCLSQCGNRRWLLVSICKQAISVLHLQLHIPANVSLSAYYICSLPSLCVQCVFIDPRRSTLCKCLALLVTVRLLLHDSEGQKP